MILAGDIGGTNIRLQWFRPNGRPEGRPFAVRQGEISRFEQYLKEEIDRFGKRPDAISLGIAGPIYEDVCDLTNVDWHVDAALIRDVTGVAHVYLINDLVALAYGIDKLNNSQMLTLQEGQRSPGNRALIAAGTGLGQSILYYDGDQYHPFATEGGHADFGPGSPLEQELLQFLSARHEHVSWERVVSGQFGFRSILDFLFHKHGSQPDLADVPDAQLGERLFVEAGRAHPIASEAVTLFLRMYGAEAGNLALKAMSTGGLYVGGGIAAKNQDWLTNGTFMQGFQDKGRFSELMETIPVRIILDEFAGLKGSAQYAQNKLQ